MKKKTKGTVSKDTKLNEILNINPEASEILFNAGMMCIGCPMAMEETLEQGCLAHGMNKKQIDDIIKRLNKK